MKMLHRLERAKRTGAQSAPTTGVCPVRLYWLMLLIFSFVFLASFSQTSAGTISYPDIAGVTVEFTEILEASGTDPVPLYGAPGHTGGNGVLFNPTTFMSLSVGAPVATDITDGQLQMTVSALEGHGIKSINFSEGGAYTVTDIPGGFAQVMAQANIFYWITEIDDSPVSPIRGTLTLGPFTATNGLDPAIGTWSLDGVLDVEQVLDDPQRRVTEVMLSIDNTLVSMAVGGTTAMIDKKEFIIDVPSVPEPSSLVLIALGMFGLGCLRRRQG